MAQITVRQANEGDVYNLVILAKEMAKFHHGLDSKYKSAEEFTTLEEDFQSELSDKDTHILIAEASSGIVGYAKGSVEKAPEYLKYKKMGKVDQVFIKEEQRKGGLGKKLFTGLLDWFKLKNLKYVELSVDARNADGVKFWKNQGFEEYKLRMSRSL